ncbi:acetyl-CoA carboxylase biotin carboxyl carrier protein subunit [Rubrivivax gelatinosus]|nr:acetyl-CoA carboxylase biotin carboxyl carrier protein subunit [Rubrivivax gelatinosus]
MERKLRITVDGKAYVVTVEELDAVASPALPLPGVALGTAAPVAASAPPPPAVAVALGDVVAPLGGTVQQVLVSVGQQVAEGEKLAVLEAMKMNTQITAPRPGKVLRLDVRAGQVVETGQPLLAIG